MNKELDVIVVTHQSYDVIDACLESLSSIQPRPHIVVVDSGSTDQTVPHLREAHPEIEVIDLGENVGFARGVNVGISRTRGRNLLLLNPDAVLMAGALDRLVTTLDRNPTAAAVGPRILDAAGHAQHSGQRFPSLKGELARTWERVARPLGIWTPATSRSGEVDWISGACFLMRRAAIEEVGQLDERFFLYFEETDWCLRAHSKGWTVLYEPAAEVLHIGGASVARSSKDGSRRANDHFLRSRRRYFQKHHGALVAWCVEALHTARSWREALRSSKSIAGGQS